MTLKSPRATNITCNISETEKVALAVVAQQRGFNTIAAFVRVCIDNECGSELQAATSFILHGDVRVCTSKNSGEQA